MLLYGSGSNPGALFAMTILAALATCFVLSRQESRLQARMENTSPSTWSVHVNDVLVGNITDAQYAKMEHVLFNDNHLLLQQSMNLAKVVFNAVTRLAWSIPMTIFWLSILLLATDQTVFSDTIQMLRAADSVELTLALKKGLWFIGMLSTASLFIAMFLGSTFGFRNCYAQALAEKIRLHCNVTTQGEVTLERHGKETMALQSGA